ncbi:protein hos4 [Anaeramoeba flamelloides]|uniref:Protein hos4 n=1 Tax=Anaeramoeba flamelloides TaxID=1746091 RepID=A0ABQ8YDJ7_9EUKA|nr:protein hos4 [Anaeramoeba flamelloides]
MVKKYHLLLLVLFLKITIANEFLDAVKYGDLGEVKRILESKDAPHVDTRYLGLTALHYASGYGFEPIVDYLLTQGADPFLLDSRHGETALHKAAQGGHVGVAKLLVERAGSFVNTRSALLGNSVSVNAVWYKHPEVTEYFMSQGGLLDLKSKPVGFTAWKMMNSSRTGGDRQQQIEWMDEHMKPVLVAQRELIDNEANDFPLYKATIDHDSKAVEELIKDGKVENIDRRTLRSGSQFDHFTCLMIASKNGDTEIVKTLIDNKADYTLIDGLFGMSSLHWASAYGHSKAVKLLLFDEIINERCDWYGFTPVHIAVLNGQTESVKELLNSKKVDISIKNELGQVALDTAIYYNYSDIIGLLESYQNENGGINSDADGNEYLSDNLFTIIQRNDLRGIYDYIIKYYDPKYLNQRDALGRTPLMISAGLGFTQMTEMLLVSGADPNLIEPRLGRTATHYAAASGVVDVVSTLVSHGGFRDMQTSLNGHSPLMEAMLFKHLLVSKFLITRRAYLTTFTNYDLNVTQLSTFFNDQEHMTLLKEKIKDLIEKDLGEILEYDLSLSLIQGTIDNDTEAVHHLLNNRLYSGNIKTADPSMIDVNAQLRYRSDGNDGHTALLISSRDNRVQITSELLSKGRARSDIISGMMRSTSLHKAGYMGRPDTLKLLLEDGRGEIDAQGPENYYTCLHDSTWHGHYENTLIITNYTLNYDLVAQNHFVPIDEAHRFNYTDIAAHYQNLIGDTDPINSFLNKSSDYITAGEIAIFTIQTVDDHNNQKTAGGDRWVVECTDESADIQVVDLHNGKYNVFISNITQAFQDVSLSFYINGALLQNTKFKLHVNPTHVDPQFSQITFINEGCSNVNDNVKLKIVLCDQFQNCHLKAWEDTKIKMFLQGGEEYLMTPELVKVSEDEYYYQATFKVSKSGSYLPLLQLDDTLVEDKENSIIYVCNDKNSCDLKSGKCNCKDGNLGDTCQEIEKSKSLSTGNIVLITLVPTFCVLILLIPIIILIVRKKKKSKNGDLDHKLLDSSDD